MTSPQLLDYIKQRLGQGANKEDLKKSLIATGWQETDIQNAFGQLEAEKNKSEVPGSVGFPKLLPKNNFYFQPNKTKALFADYRRENINSVEKSCGVASKETEMLAPISDKLLTTENAIGKMMYDAFNITLSLDVQMKKRCQEDFLVSVTQLQFALKAYNLEMGGYPSTLIGLVPRYLSKVPEDPFDGKPIRYSATKKIIYSVGKDAIDSGGSEGDDWHTMPDPTFKIEF